MSTLTEWVNARPKLKQWLWFIGLWCMGLLAVSAMAYPIKMLIRSMG